VKFLGDAFFAVLHIQPTCFCRYKRPVRGW